MRPALNGSTALQRFKHGNMVEIHNGIIFDFYPGLPHMCSHGSHDLHLLSLQVYTDGQEHMMMSFFIGGGEEEECVTSYSGRGESRISCMYYK